MYSSLESSPTTGPLPWLSFLRYSLTLTSARSASRSTLLRLSRFGKMSVETLEDSAEKPMERRNVMFKNPRSGAASHVSCPHSIEFCLSAYLESDPGQTRSFWYEKKHGSYEFEFAPNLRLYASLSYALPCFAHHRVPQRVPSLLGRQLLIAPSH